MSNAPIRFALEELYLLQQALNIEVLPGMKPDILDGFSQERRQEALTCADHTLRARNWIGWRDANERVIHPVLVTTLRDYASSHHTIFVDTLINSRRAIPFLYVFGEQGIYEQCQPEDNVLQFRLLEDCREVRRRLSPRSIVEATQDQVNVRGTIKLSTLKEGLKMVREDVETAHGCFAKALPDILAADLACAYHEPKIVQYLACWNKSPSSDHSDPLVTFTILVGPKQVYVLWVEEPAKGDDALVRAMPATSQLLNICIEKLLPSDLTPYQKKGI